MHMELTKPSQVLHLSAGDVITKRNLFDLIQYSKVPDSAYWGGKEDRIWNTPQQGINWLGQPPCCQAVLIKTRKGSYEYDGWKDDAKTEYRYSFKSVKGKISHSEKANAVLVNQPLYGYPILLFTEDGSNWSYQGSFKVVLLEKRYVDLQRGHGGLTNVEPISEHVRYTEGDRKYVSHLMMERSRAAVSKLKANSESVCDICTLRPDSAYGVDFIEAHHKTPMNQYSAEHTVDLNDFVLLCPNCHRAVHIYMKNLGLEYHHIKKLLTKER